MFLSNFNRAKLNEIQNAIKEDFEDYKSRFVDDEGLLQIARKCESPIEAIMFWEFVHIFKLETVEPQPGWGNKGTVFTLCPQSDEDGNYIFPSQLVGKIDYLSVYVQNVVVAEGKLYRPDFEIQVWNAKIEKAIDFIIEVDGHDFHEKTKVQAARDKKRDRLLQKVGYRIMHFTGSEVYKDSLAVTFEIVEYMGSELRKASRG